MSKTNLAKKKPAKATVKPRQVVEKPSRKFDIYFIATIIVVICIALIRLRLVDVPLERDEGEYGYIGKLIFEGIAPYKEAYNMKLPGTYFMYGLLMQIFGKNISGIHYGLLLVNSATIFLLFFSFRKIFNPSIGFFAAATYGLMSVSPPFFGFAAHATQFVSLFISLALFFLAKFLDERKWLNAFLTGLFFGLAFLMKQQAVFFILFGGIIVLLADLMKKPVRIKTVFLNAGTYSIAAIIPYVLTVFILKMAGAFDKFWFWTVTYASKYAEGLTFDQGKIAFKISFDPMWDQFSIFWILFFAGLILVFLSKFSVQKKIIAILFAVFAFLTVCPGFYFRQHYFVSFLPGLGLMAGISVDWLANLISRGIKLRSLSWLSILIFGLLSIAAVSKNKDYYFRSEPDEISRSIYGNNPFPESVEIANYIKANSDKSDKIAVLGSEPQIFLYADRHSATGYIYAYPLMEPQQYNKQMQQNMIDEIEKAKPKFIIFCKVSASWLKRPESPTLIFDWFDKYQQSYTLAGIADLVPGQTVYKWNAEALTYQPRSMENVFVFKRNN